ncbi:MAG: hypothetical protein IJZ74_10965 [Clostridia bacterium]|nr:hypothetical protein [Clostridia bacterium]
MPRRRKLARLETGVKEVSHLQSRLREALAHGAVALLFALGMVLMLLGVTGLLRYGWMAAALLTAMTAIMTAASMNRRAAWVLTGAALVGGVGWLTLGGMGTVVEVMQATVLHMSGLKTALPLVAGEAAAMICVLCAAASFFVTYRSAGAYPALILLLLAVVLLWLGDQTHVLWALLPSVVACVTLLLQSGDDDIRTFRVLPLAVVTTVISFTGVAVGGATIPPLKDAADALRQKIYDIFFFTDPRDVFSLATEGYYPQGQNQLGGPAEPHENPVMVVITPRKTYLRGVVKNVYTGRSWVDETGGRRYLWESSRWQNAKAAAFDMERPEVADLGATGILQPYTITVRMLADSASSMFVPQRVRSLEAEGDLTPYFNMGSEIFATRNLTLGDVWTVEAPLYRAGDTGVEALVSACENATDDNWEYVNRTYRALPGHLEQAVYDIAYEAVAGADTPYEMAWALQQYLAGNYTYKLDVAEQPPELDFVSTFLLLEKEGYCTYFASAMTVLCRMVGLPARYVEGYLASPDAEGKAIVTGREGHAWTEVYFKGFGWLTFDATPWSAETTYISPDQLPDAPNPPEQSPEPTATPTQSPEPVQTPSPTPNTEQSVPTETPDIQQAPDDEQGHVQRNEKAASALWWLLLVLMLMAAAAIRVLFTRPDIRAGRQKKPFARWLVWAQAVHDGLRMLDLVRLESETPIAFFRRVDASGKLPLSLQALGETESLMFYGHAIPEPGEIDAFRRAYEVICRRLNIGQRILLALQRAFMPRRSHDITA